MERFFAVILTIIVVFTLSGCNNESNSDINEFLKIFNTYGEYGLNSSDFTVIENEENYVSSVLIDDEPLISLYADSNNEIVQCTVTTDKRNKEKYYKICKDVFSTLTGADEKDSDRTIKSLKITQQEKYDGWLITEIVNEIGSTFIVNRENNELNTNTLPTLKDFIKKEDITRQTAVKTTEKPNLTHY